MRNNEILEIGIGETSDAPLIIPAPEEKELFEHYEFKSWSFSPRVFKAFGAGTLITFLTVFTFGQFNLMQSRACDNGIVGQMCQVLDAVYIATVLGGKNNEWKSWEEEGTKIEDADITYIDVSNVEPQLQYPDGYFALANPESYNQTSPDGQLPNNSEFPPINGFPPPSSPMTTIPNTGTGEDLLGKPAELPKTNNDPLKGDIPDSPFGTANDSAPKSTAPPRIRQPRFPKSQRIPKLPNESPKLPKDSDLAQNSDKNKNDKKEEPKSSPTPVDPSALTDARINKSFLEKFLKDVVEKTEGEKPIDLKQPFSVEMTGVLAADGKLNTKKTRFTNESGDEEMRKIGKSAIEALNNSSLLSYLKDFGVENVKFVLSQDDKELTAVIMSPQATDEKANSLASQLRLGIALAKMRGDEDLKGIIDAAKVTSEGKNFMLTVAIPKDEAHKMIDKRLQEARAKEKGKSGLETSSSITPSAR